MTYNEFIEDIVNTRGKWNIPKGEYFEVHHIIPRCMGGEGVIRKGKSLNKHPNLIYLYAREHFVAHKLLALENPTNRKLVSAWSMMAFPKGKTKRDFEITPEEYEELRKLLSAQISGKNNPFLKNGEPWNKGKTGVYSEETLRRIREPRPNAQGRKVSEQTKIKMSQAVRKRYSENPDSFAKPTFNKRCITNGEINIYIGKEEQIPEGFRIGQIKRNGYNIKDTEAYSVLRSKQVSGSNNPMYGNGHRISGGKNGHAVYIYTYMGIDYTCRDDLMIVLKKDFPSISESTIRRIMKGNYTERTSKKYQYVIDNLSWRLKSDENKIS